VIVEGQGPVNLSEYAPRPALSESSVSNEQTAGPSNRTPVQDTDALISSGSNRASQAERNGASSSFRPFASWVKSFVTNFVDRRPNDHANDRIQILIDDDD
jgi:hypothetical protein